MYSFRIPYMEVGLMSSVTAISAINLKGGAAKTSTILNLGGVLQENGRRPILIDLDPQQSAKLWATQGGKHFPFPVTALEISKNIKQFKETLDRLVREYEVDIILFDTPPQIQDEALLAALLSDIVLVPITPSLLDISAGEKAIGTIREARQTRGGELPKIILVPSRLSPNTLLAKEICGTLEKFGESISPTISHRVAMIEACVAGLPVN